MKTLDFIQPTPSTTWTIQHNFGTKVVSDIWVNNGQTREKILPQNVVHTDDNTLVITFSQSFSGGARIMSIAGDFGELTVPNYGTVEGFEPVVDPEDPEEPLDPQSPDAPASPTWLFLDNFNGNNGQLVSTRSPDIRPAQEMWVAEEGYSSHALTGSGTIRVNASAYENDSSLTYSNVYVDFAPTTLQWGWYVEVRFNNPPPIGSNTQISVGDVAFSFPYVALETPDGQTYFEEGNEQDPGVHTLRLVQEQDGVHLFLNGVEVLFEAGYSTQQLSQIRIFSPLFGEWERMHIDYVGVNGVVVQ